MFQVMRMIEGSSGGFKFSILGFFFGGGRKIGRFVVVPAYDNFRWYDALKFFMGFFEVNFWFRDFCGFCKKP